MTDKPRKSTKKKPAPRVIVATPGPRLPDLRSALAMELSKVGIAPDGLLDALDAYLDARQG